MKRILCIAALVQLIANAQGTPPATPRQVLVATFEQAMISAPPATLGLDPFYKKYADAYGIPVVSSEKVPDAALLMARDIINYMLLKRPDVRAVMIQKKSRLLVMARVEGEMDLPERRDWKKPTIDDRRLTPGERTNYNNANGIANMTDAQLEPARPRDGRQHHVMRGGEPARPARVRATTASTSPCTSSVTTS